MDKFGAIILAAGLSRRMGQKNKLLLPINGVPMIRHVIETYLAAVDGEVCVVTGFEASKVEAALEGLPVRFIHNEVYEKGQPFSVSAGLLAAPDAENLLIGLGDQPELTTSDLDILMAAHLSERTAKVSIPYLGEVRGNPIIVPSSMGRKMLADKANPGCGKFTRTNPDMVMRHPLPQPGFYHDIDTPAAFQALRETRSESAES
jgi:molybdenum cofactor cytidylyltransferase